MIEKHGKFRFVNNLNRNALFLIKKADTLLQSFVGYKADTVSGNINLKVNVSKKDSSRQFRINRDANPDITPKYFPFDVILLDPKESPILDASPQIIVKNGSQ
jgi:hypothetical protein